MQGLTPEQAKKTCELCGVSDGDVMTYKRSRNFPEAHMHQSASKCVTSLRAQLTAREQERDEARQIAARAYGYVDGVKTLSPETWWNDHAEKDEALIASWAALAPSQPPQTTETT